VAALELLPRNGYGRYLGAVCVVGALPSGAAGRERTCDSAAALARSKNSVTHLWANAVILASTGFEALDGAIALLDPEINQQIVTAVGDLAGAHVAAAKAAS
jgi:hypothetical protein